MDVGGLGLFGQLKGKMHWHNSRQNVLAENVANADTPKFRGKDFRPYKADSLFDKQLAMKAVTTDGKHMELMGTFTSGHRAGKSKSYETTPYGNSVTAEQEMLKVTQNQMDYQVASTVYQRNLGILKLAVRR